MSRNAPIPRIQTTLSDLVRAVDDSTSAADETAAVVRYVLRARRARFVDDPLIRALKAERRNARRESRGWNDARV